MSTLILDIETVGEDWDVMSETSKESLTRWIERSGDPQEVKDKKRDEVKSRLGLSPFTGSIASLAMYDIERDLGAAYFVSDTPDESFKSDSFTFKQRTEKEILEEFWEGASNYDIFVSFNGRTFAVPFLYHRSVVNKVKPSVEIARQRYLTKQPLPYHVDLMDELTFYGAMQKRPSLQLVCDSYDITYNKDFGGGYITDLFKMKKFRHIAEHNAQDVLAIKQLYSTWKEYLAPRSFLNTLEM